MTFEYGLDCRGTVIASLCGWRGTRHLNFGVGPEPTMADFRACLGL
jgi:hypothetical protein